jgi:hypothetical protein
MTPSAEIQSIASFHLRLARAKDKEVISPFQYYTEKGEVIQCLDRSSQTGSGRQYLHSNSQGEVLSRLNLGDMAIEADWEGAEHEQEDKVPFGELMHEMHVAAKSGPLFDPADMDNLLELGSGEPILVVGCGRSGTTLLLSILGAHPEILAVDEESYAFYPFPFRLSPLVNALQDQKQKAWTRWCEKTPKHVRAIPEIIEAFEGKVKIVHLVRDGRDVVTSKHPNADREYYISPERWVADVGAGWANKQYTLLLRYEDLVLQPRESLAVLCEHLELEFDERMLDFEQFSTVKANKAWEGSQVSALSKESVARWQGPEYAERIQEFLNFPGSTKLMEQLDYL